MKTTVEKLIAELTALRIEEMDLQKRLDANRQRQAAIMGSLQVKTDASEETTALPIRRPPLANPRRAAKVLREKTRSTVRPTAAVARRPEEERSAADLVREYVAQASDDALITPEAAATALGLKSSTVSTVLNRLIGKVIERAAGSQRGKFRKIKRAA
jgi:CRP-like cAMP-binding protein